MDEWTLFLVPHDELLILPSSLWGEHSCDNLDTGSSDVGESSAGYQRIWILHRANHTRNAGGDQRLRARRRLPVMIMGFKRNISRPAACPLTGLCESGHLGVSDLIFAIETLTNY